MQGIQQLKSKENKKTMFQGGLWPTPSTLRSFYKYFFYDQFL